MQGKKILFISYNGMTDPLGQAQVLPYLFGLARHGFHITVLSVEKEDRMAREGVIVRTQMERGGLSWHPLIFHKALPFVSKLYDRSQLKKAALNICRRQKIDIVHCRSYVSAEVGLAIKRKMGIPFIFDMRGFWADEKRDSGHWNWQNPFYKILYRRYKRLEKELLLEAGIVVVLTHAAKEEILTWSLTTDVSDKILVIPCCADLQHFSESNIDLSLQARLKEDLNLVDAFPVVSYLGSIGEAYAINEMLYFFSRLKVQYSRAKFLFLTKDDPQLVLDKVRQFPELSNSDLVVRFASRKEVPTYLSLCTFSIFFYRPTYSRIACSPTKFAEISGLGIPVVCNSVGDLNLQYLAGLPHIVLNSLSSESIEDSISMVPMLLKADKIYIRQFAEKRYNLEDGIQSYLGAYKTILA